MGLTNWLVGGDATNEFKQQAAPKYSNYGAGVLQQALGNGVGNQQIDYGQSQQARGQMQGLAGQLQGVAGGQAKGAGELAVDRQMNQAAAAQQAMARISRGSNAALAARQAARNTADMGVAAAGQGQIAALQDQAAARGQLQQLLGGMRGQDLQTNQIQQQQQAQNAQQQLSYLAQLMGIDQQRLQYALAQNQIAGADTGHLGSLLQAAGTIGGAVAGGPGGAAAGAQAGKALG